VHDFVDKLVSASVPFSWRLTTRASLLQPAG
jgi:hypothetical protein